MKHKVSLSMCLVKAPLLILFALLLLASSACVTSAPMNPAPDVEDAKASFDPSEAQRVLAESVAAWSAGDLEGFMEAYADDCLFITSAF